MPGSLKEMLAGANRAVPRISPEEARRMMEAGALVIDVRDAPELQQAGKLTGAKHVSRGMLEFRADPESPYHDAAFDRTKPVLLYCASGGRAALAGKALQELGYERVYNLGGFKELADAGLPTDPPGA